MGGWGRKMSKTLTLISSMVLALLPVAAQALGLGEIKLNSALNDKFSADIQVIGATSDELDSLDVKLASLKQFSQAGIDHPDVLGQLQFLVVRNPDGTAYIHISSPQAVREPFLDFLLDANWNNGELIREYTVLLNPPSFQNAEAPAQAAPQPAASAASAPAPAVAAAPVVAAPVAPTQSALQPAAPVAAASQPAPSPATSPPAAPAETVTPAPAEQRALGANYGPIHRGETLSGIAKSMRPQGVTLNQMMIAIYQANPEVFMHNINRMKAGFILRMPALSDVQAVSVTDANSEVRAQIEAWRSSRGTPAPSAGSTVAAAPTQPSLTLVAPSSAAENNAPVPGAAKAGSSGTAAAPATAEQQKTSETATALPPPPPAPSQAPISVQSNPLAAVQQQAAQQPPAPSVAPLSSAPAALPPAAKPAPAAGGGIMDILLSPYVLGAVGAVIVIVLIGVAIKKRRQSKPSAFGGGAAGKIKGADWLKQEQAGGDDDKTSASESTTRTKSKQTKKAAEDKTVMSEPPTQVGDEGDSDKTQLMPQGHMDTMVGAAAAAEAAPSAKLDVSDPLAEADFHMAYGLYDQAADVLRKSLRQDPNRREVAVKLLEVFFTAGDKGNFITEAKKLRQAMGGSAGKEWDSVAIMGRQLAPDEAMFSASGAGAAAVDIALDGGGTGTVLGDLGGLGEAFEAPAAAPAAEPAPAPAPAADNSLDFSLPDLEPEPIPAPAPAPAPAPSADGGLEFNVGDLNYDKTMAIKKKDEPKKAEPPADEPTVATDFGTDSQVEFDKALTDLASFVNTNVPAQPEAAAAPSMEGLSMDAPAAAPAAEEATGTTSSISEVGTKLDLARAYIDMGDPDGAKSILEEVVLEGNAQQKQEAQELLKHVSG